MTILVGVKCIDGIVIGSDSIATSSAGAMPVMQVFSGQKIRIFNESVIVAATGAVGNTQRLHHHVDAALRGGVFSGKVKTEIATNISRRLLTDFQNSMMPSHPHHGIGFGAIMAAAICDEPCLIEYATNNFQPEFRQDSLFYVSTGSGQPLADPFLAFISRVLWKGASPNLLMGKIGVVWALNHTLSLAPGTVGPPICISTLSRVGGRWVARLDENLDEANQFIDDLEKRIGSNESEDDAPPIPELRGNV